MLRAKSLSRVPLSSMALMLSSSLRHSGIIGLPVDEKLDLILLVAFRDATLDGLDDWTLLVSASLRGVPIPTLFSSASGSRLNSMPPLASVIAAQGLWPKETPVRGKFKCQLIKGSVPILWQTIEVRFVWL